MVFCRLFNSAIQSARLRAAWIAVWMVGMSTPLKAEDPSFVAVAKSYLSRAMKSISDRFGDDSAKGGPKAKDPDQVARQAVLDDLLGSIFLEEKGYRFTQSRWGARPIPYQIDELEVIELPAGTLNGADTAEGIDQRISYELKTTAFRLYEESKGWGEWIKGTPPHLTSVTLVRQNGGWKVSASPARAYSLK